MMISVAKFRLCNVPCRGLGSVQKSPCSKATAIFARGAYWSYVSTEKWRERRWRLFSTDLLKIHEIAEKHVFEGAKDEICKQQEECRAVTLPLGLERKFSRRGLKERQDFGCMSGNVEYQEEIMSRP